MMRRAAALSLMLALVSAAATAEQPDAPLRAALEAALARWPAATAEAPAAEALERRLAEDRETLRRLRDRRDTLDRQIDQLDARIAVLKARLAADPNAMRTPRDQVALLALHDQRQTTRGFRDALAHSIAARRREVARTEVRLLAAEGGRAALEARLNQLGP